MTNDRIKELLDAEPFRPFRIRMADGRAIPVRHREFLASSPTGRTITVFQPDDSLNIIDVMLITDLELSPRGKK